MSDGESRVGRGVIVQLGRIDHSVKLVEGLVEQRTKEAEDMGPFDVSIPTSGCLKARQGWSLNKGPLTSTLSKSKSPVHS